MLLTVHILPAVPIQTRTALRAAAEEKLGHRWNYLAAGMRQKSPSRSSFILEHQSRAPAGSPQEAVESSRAMDKVEEALRGVRLPDNTRVVIVCGGARRESPAAPGAGGTLTFADRN